MYGYQARRLDDGSMLVRFGESHALDALEWSLREYGTGHYRELRLTADQVVLVWDWRRGRPPGAPGVAHSEGIR